MLSSLVLLTPYLANPTDVISLSSSVLPLVVQAATSVISITIQINSVTTTYSTYTVQNDTNGNPQFNIFSIYLPTTIASSPVQIYIQGFDGSSPVNYTPVLTISYLYVQSAGLPTLTPPSGVTVYMGLTSCKVEWVRPDQLQSPTSNLLGVNVLYSSDPTGITTPYQQYSSSLVKTVSRVGQNVVSSTTSSTGPQADVVTLVTGALTFFNSNNSIVRSEGDWVSDGVTVGSLISLSGFNSINPNNNKTFTVSSVFNNTIQPIELVSNFSADSGVVQLSETTSTTTTTITEESYPINYSNAIFQSSTTTNSNLQFYVILSSVVQNIADNKIYESSYAGPFTCGFVDLRQVQPTDFPYVQQKESIATRLINSTISDYPDLDLTPRSELRDVLVDPVSLELANQSIREWFGRLSNSISAMATLDDTNGDGLSDPVASSPYKPLIASAWNLSATDTQAFIDNQFDILAERAGLTRGPATPAIAPVTFYTYIKPTGIVTFDTSIQVGTTGDSDTAALTFDCVGSQIIDTTNLNSIYDSANGWWAVTLPCQCETAGSSGNVGAGGITVGTSGIPANWLVTNLTPANFGTDGETNALLAARIKNALVIGVDSGRRVGYWETAITTPGVVDVTVVASGDPSMLRDWYPQANRHLYGCVDVYVRGTQQSVNTQPVPFSYASLTGSPVVYSFTPAIAISNGLIPAKYAFSTSSTLPLANVFSLSVTSPSGTIYLGVTRVLIEGTSFQIDPTEFTYTTSGNNTIYGATNGVFLKNLLQANPNLNNVTLQATFKTVSPLQYTSALQPVTDIYSVTGTITGVIDPDYYRLIITEDPMLVGFSNEADNLIQVDSTNYSVIATPVQIQFSTFSHVIPSGTTNGYQVGGNTQLLGSGIILSNSNDVISVLSSDLSTLYTNGIDYLIVGVPPYGAGYQHGSYAIQRIDRGVSAGIQPSDTVQVTFNQYAFQENCNQQTDSLQVYVNNNSPVYLTQSGLVQGTWVIDSYGYAPLNYNSVYGCGGPFPVSYITPGSVYTIASIGTTDFTLIGAASNTIGLVFTATSTVPTGSGTVDAPVLWSSDSDLANMPYASRFIKATYLVPSVGALVAGRTYTISSLGTSPTATDFTLIGAASNTVGLSFVATGPGIGSGEVYSVLTINEDFSLTVDPISKQASIQLIQGNPSGIPNGATLSITYFYNEEFTIISAYPGYISQVATAIESMRNAGADVVVKNVITNPVDMSMTVQLAPNASVQSVDNSIRTSLGICLTNASGTLYQSNLVYQIQSLPGVLSVQLPLTKLCKGDGAYIVGQLLPVGTSWTPISSISAFNNLPLNPATTFITSSPVLTDNTLPSGGKQDAFAGFLYEGDTYTRCSSLAQLAQNSVTLHSNVSATAGNFYIIGQGDPADPTGVYAGSVVVDFSTLFIKNSAYQPFSPAFFPFRVTYEVWNETGTKDITVSSTEYLQSGVITIDYVSQD